MQRRSFLAKAATTAGTAALAAPAVAQGQPAVNWRLASSFPKTLDTIYAAAEDFVRRVPQLTHDGLQIRQFAANEIVPGLQMLDAVQANTVEIGHTPAYYYFGKDPTFAFDCAVPFGLTSRQQTAWMEHAGGRALLREFYRYYGIVNFLGRKYGRADGRLVAQGDPNGV